jgi:hypothetical protein
MHVFNLYFTCILWNYYDFQGQQLIRCKQLLSGKIHNKNLSIFSTPPKPEEEMLVLQEVTCHVNTSIKYLMYKRDYMFSQQFG